jgi:hypothetical protein
VNLFKREPALVIGTVATVLVCAYAYWRGLSVEEVLVQVAALGATFVAVRSQVTPYVDGMFNKHGGTNTGGVVNDGGATTLYDGPTS